MGFIAIYNSSFDYSDLSNSHIGWMIVLNSDFEKIILNNADIRDTTFINTDLKFSKFLNVYFEETSFIKCNLKGINFTKEQLDNIETLYLCNLDDNLYKYIEENYKNLLDFPLNKKFNRIKDIMNYEDSTKKIDTSYILKYYGDTFFIAGDVIHIINKQIFP